MELNISEISELNFDMNDFANPYAQNNASKKVSVSNMFQQKQTPVVKQVYPSSCEVKRQLISEHKQQQSNQSKQSNQSNQSNQSKQSNKQVKECKRPELKPLSWSQEYQEQYQKDQKDQEEQYEGQGQVKNEKIKAPIKTPYDDILSKLNVKIVNGQMQFIQASASASASTANRNSSKTYNLNNQTNQTMYADKVRNQMAPPQTDPKTANIYTANIYTANIYTKYFGNHNKAPSNSNNPNPNPGQRLMTKEEYKAYILQRELSIQRIRQIKSKKLIMPTSNIHISNQGNMSNNPGGLNKMFALK
jgi:hypothetical protein